ncbi:MAG: hypothetical protein ACP5SH_09980 [Syntrophobacteraceae bacterium]
MIRVFPRRTSWTPTDPMAFVGDPSPLLPTKLHLEDHPVRISVTFTWDKPEGERLLRAWSRFYRNVELGGPAYASPSGEFTPGLFVKPGVVFTSRGCSNRCPFCLVPLREGPFRPLLLTEGHNVADNNVLLHTEERLLAIFDMLRRQPHPAIFSGGLDARRFSPWHVSLLSSIRLKYAFFACDSPSDLPHLQKVAGLLSSFSREKKRCYVLIGFNGETPSQAESRLKAVYHLDFLPFAMLYRGPDARTRNTPEFHDLVGIWRSPAAYKLLMEGPRRPRKGGTQLTLHP